MTKKFMTEPWWQKHVDNIKLTNVPQFPFNETTIERLVVDHMRTRCDLCGALKGANKHTAVFVVLGVRLCWCCWFDHAFYQQHDWKPMNGERYYNSPSRARRRAECSQIGVHGTPSLGDPYANYIRSRRFDRDVTWERLRKMFGG